MVSLAWHEGFVVILYVITALHLIGFVQTSPWSILPMDKNMISECCDQYLGNQYFTSWSLSYQIGSLPATAWFLFPVSLCPEYILNVMSITVLSMCYRFVTFSALSIIIFAKDVLVKKNIIPLRVKKILFWQVANYRQLLHNFRVKWAVICPEGTWSSHEGKWPHVSWKELKSKNLWQLGCLGSINLSLLFLNFK